MYCRKCGTQIPPQGSFCPKCGVSSDLGPIYGTNIIPPPEEKRKQVGRMVTLVLVPIIFMTLFIMIFSVDRSLIGKWEITSDDSPEYMEFYSDGTMVMGDYYTLDPDGDDKYNYETSGNNLTLENGENTIELEYHVEDDYLELTVDDDNTILYRKL